MGPASALDSCPPRPVNGQAVVLRRRPGEEAELEVLLQLRSERMQVMAGHLGAIGGCRDACDADSRATALREVQEETGLVAGIQCPPAKFAEGGRCDWYVMTVCQPVFGAAPSGRLECGDVGAVLPLLPPSASRAECFGHAWLPLRDLALLGGAGGPPLMGGLVARVRAAAQHLEALESEARPSPPAVASALRASGIELGAGGAASVASAAPPARAAHQAGAVGEEAADAQEAAVNLGALRSQIEYYLGDHNLSQDRFFHEKISADAEGWLDVQLLLNCNKLRAMGAAAEDVAAAMQRSELELRADGRAVRRRGNAPLPPLQESQRSGLRGGRGRGGRRSAGAPGRGRGGVESAPAPARGAVGPHA